MTRSRMRVDIDGVGLTSRQVDVLALRSKPRPPSVAQIAGRLGIEVKSVRNLMQQIRQAFGLEKGQPFDEAIDRYRRATRPRGIPKVEPAIESIEDGIIRRGTLLLCDYTDEDWPLFLCDPTARVRAIWDPVKEASLPPLKTFRLQTPTGVVQSQGDLLALTLPSAWVEDELKVETSDAALESCIWWRVKIEISHDFVDAVVGKPCVCVVERVLVGGKVEVNCPPYDEYLHAEYPVYNDLITTLRSTASTFALMNDVQLREWIAEQFEGLDSMSYHRPLRDDRELFAVLAGLRFRSQWLMRDHIG